MSKLEKKHLSNAPWRLAEQLSRVKSDGRRKERHFIDIAPSSLEHRILERTLAENPELRDVILKRHL